MNPDPVIKRDGMHYFKNLNFLRPLIILFQWLRNIVFFIFITLSLLYLGANTIYEYQDTLSNTHLPEVDAIICLAGGRGRIMAAGDLWFRYWQQAQELSSHSGKLPLLYFSGIGYQTHWDHILKHLRAPVSQVLQPKHIIIESSSLNTIENAHWVLRFAKAGHWNKIILLTSSYHMKRAQFIFEHIFKKQNHPMHIETCSVSQDPFTVHDWKKDTNGIRVTLNEYLKGLYYRLIYASK